MALRLHEDSEGKSVTIVDHAQTDGEWSTDAATPDKVLNFVDGSPVWTDIIEGTLLFPTHKYRNV
jgi:hypothetical protein